MFSPSVENLVAQLTRLPGIGTRTAQRLAFHILQRPADEAGALASALTVVKERVRFCRDCGNLTEDEVCAICLDQRRDHTTICVVEQPVDVVSLERTHEYRGLYHVLGGALSPLDGVEPGDLRIDELLQRVAANGVVEVVLATNPTMTGEATAAYLADRLRDRVRVTRLASGLPVGGDLEYADEVTLGRALSGRREMSTRQPLPYPPMSDRNSRIGVVGATGAVGTLTLELLRARGYTNVRAFASARSAGKRLGDLVVEEATPEALSAGDVDLFLFSVGTGSSRELVPHAVRGGAVVIDKSAAFRLTDGIPLVVPEVNGARALENDGIVANPNCCTIPLTCVLKPLYDAVGLARVRVATYQSVSGAGAQAMDRLAHETPADHDLRMDWDFDGEEFDEESKLRAETQKIMELPDLLIQATCVRVPVMVGHAEAVWIETEQPLSAEQARELLAAAPSVRVEEFPSPGKAAGEDEVLVGRIRRDPTVENGIALFIACDNLRKGAALNGIQVAELLLAGLPAAV